MDPQPGSASHQPPPPGSGMHQPLPQGSATYQPLPPPPQMSGWGGIVERVLGLTSAQFQTLMLACGSAFLGWLLYDMTTEGRKNDTERTAMMVRAFESEGEKARAQTDKIQAAVADVGKFTVAASSKMVAEMAKLEVRVNDLATTNTKLAQQLAELTTVITELKKKLPPSEEESVVAPIPRARGGG